MMNPSGGSAARVTPHMLRRFFQFLLRYWWLPLLTLFLGILGEAIYVHCKAPTFVSHASMWETLKLKLPEGAVFSEDVQNFLGTQSELLQSDKLRELALARMMSMTNSMGIPRGRDGRPLPVDIRVAENLKSSVFMIEARSSDPLYTHN